VSRGYGLIKFTRDFAEMQCPVCSEHDFELRNVGFVNAEWTIRAILKKKKLTKVYSEGRTYDGKLYTF